MQTQEIGCSCVAVHGIPALACVVERHGLAGAGYGPAPVFMEQKADLGEA